VKADEAYLRESIINPPAKLVAGFWVRSCRPFKDRLSESQFGAADGIHQVPADCQPGRASTPVPSPSVISPARGNTAPTNEIAAESFMTPIETFEPPVPSKVNYINAEYGLKGRGS